MRGADKKVRGKTEFDRLHNTYQATFMDLYAATVERRSQLRIQFSQAFEAEREGFIRRLEALDALLSNDNNTQLAADTAIQDFLKWAKEITWTLNGHSLV